MTPRRDRRAYGTSVSSDEGASDFWYGRVTNIPNDRELRRGLYLLR